MDRSQNAALGKLLGHDHGSSSRVRRSEIPPRADRVAASEASDDGVDERSVRCPNCEPVTSERVFDLVYDQIRKLAGARHDVEELTQAAAEQALRCLPAFEGRSRLSTWTFRICYLTLRKHDRWLFRWLRRFSFSTDGALPEQTSESAEGDVRLASKERSIRLQAALDRLSEKQRTVVMMHDLEGLAIDEIACIVKARPRAVRSRLRDGRKALGEVLARDPYFGDEACRRGERR